MSAITDQYDPLIKPKVYEDHEPVNFVLFIVICLFIVIWLIIIGNNIKPITIPIKMNSVLSRVIPINSSILFEHEGTKYELIFEQANE